MERDSGLSTGMTMMALLRAIEAARPETERLFDDPISRHLVAGIWRAFLLPGLGHLLVALTEKRGPGALGNLYCRTRYIDDALRRALAGGLEQVVILGAGFDCRAYRIPGIEQTRVFEVDLPAPQHLKQERLQDTFGRLPAHVTFIPIDFNRQNLNGELAAAGFRANARTFFVWEGVTQYITAEAVDLTFRYVARAGATGSEIAFTYIHRGIIEGYARSELDETLMSLARQGGSPWIFGLDPAELPRYLDRRGLALVEEVWTPDYRQRYLEPSGRQIDIFDGEHVVLARTKAAR